MSVGHLLTLQSFMDKHLKPPPPVQGSLKEIFTEIFKLFVKEFKTVTFAVGGTVSARITYTVHISISIWNALSWSNSKYNQISSKTQFPHNSLICGPKQTSFSAKFLLYDLQSETLYFEMITG